MPTATELPAAIGGYRILARLGAGGMATVYRALQVGLQREVALKVVAQHLAGDADFGERFLREARAGALVNHVNVVACFDAGRADGQLYMAMELVSGGDLAQLLERKGGTLDEALALNLMRDSAAGLEAIEAAGLIHRDLKPANIFLTERGVAKLADLGLVRFTGDDRVTQPGMVMGTPAYISPEQARGVADVDIRTDIYSLGASLYHLVTGSPPYSGDSPLTTLVKALNEPLPDPRALRPDLSDTVVAIINRAAAKDRAQRYASARQLREDLECALAGSALRHARQATGATPAKGVVPVARRPAEVKPSASRTVAPGGARPIEPIALPTPPPIPAAALRIDPEQLKALTKRILVDKDGLKASLVLAPGASFPRFLLDQILSAANIVHGVVQGAVNEATRPSSIPRRIILARGDPPSPGMTGMDVRGMRVPPLEARVAIRIADDGLTAVALTHMGRRVAKEELEPVLRASQVRYGLDLAAIRRLVDGPPDPQGRLIIARGLPPRPPRPPGFLLGRSTANTTLADLAGSTNLQRVTPGTVLAGWQAGEAGAPGMDVLGRKLPVAPLVELQPDDCVGEGTELGRDRDGNVVLRATRAGLCQRQDDGAVRVVGAIEIDGDLTAANGPIVTDELVVIRGNVAAGASISSSSDVVVLGDLQDAKVISGGSLQVAGVIRAGDQPLTIAGHVSADGTEVRRIMAGSLRISGEVRNCELLATGDITVGRVVGGSLTAGGSVNVDVAGDGDGTTTELWAGHHLNYAQQAELARLADKCRSATRERLLADRQAAAAEIAALEQKQQRIGSSQYAREGVLDEMSTRKRRLDQAHAEIAAEDEQARLALAQQLGVSRTLKGLTDNAKCGVKVKIVAHEGVVCRLADVEPEILDMPRLKYELGTS